MQLSGTDARDFTATPCNGRISSELVILVSVDLNVQLQMAQLYYNGEFNFYAY
jgi:hypothetical protein